MNNSQVAHAWAHQTKPEAKGSNFRFDGTLLYSYSTVIGQIEGPFVFISSDNMSATTSKHLCYAKRATLHLTTILTPAFRYGNRYRLTPEELLQPLYDQLIKDYQKLPRLRTNLNYAINAYNENKDLLYQALNHFQTTIPQDLPTSDNFKEKAKLLQEQEEKKRKEKAEKEELKRQQAREEARRDFESWLRGESVSCPYAYSSIREAFLTIRNNIVYTSQHCEAPLDHVKKALAFYDSVPRPYQTNGHKIHLGHYVLDSIDEQGNIKVGCHLFTAEEIARFRKEWNV